MDITMTWTWDPKYPDEGPTLVSAYDEHVSDSWMRVPDWYTEEIQQFREVVLTVDAEQIWGLFDVPKVEAQVKPDVERFIGRLDEPHD